MAEVSALGRLVREGSDEDIQRFFLLLRPPELADLLEQVEEDDRLRVLRLMTAPLAAEVLREVDDAERGEILEDLSSGELAPILEESRSDDAADLIAELPPDKAERTLNKMDAEDRSEIRELLTYDEETAGGIMQTEVVAVHSDVTVAQAIEAVRAVDTEDVGEIHEVFVVDRDNRLVGAVSPADLLQEPPDTLLRALVEPNPVAVPVTMDQEDIAELVREHDLATIPVVDEKGALVGQILHDDVADVLEEEATEDIAKMAGPDPHEPYEDRLLAALRARAPWLVPAFAGGLGVALFLGSAERDIASAPLLAAFLPVILGMAGNVGTQTSAITVRGLALGRIEFGRSGRIIRRQILTGLTLGIVFSLLLGAFALLRGDAVADMKNYAVVASLSIFAAMTVGASMGVIVPILLHRIGFDPAIASSPFVQTANDLTGVPMVIVIARWTGLLA